MNIAPLGVTGAPLAQTKGPAQERALEETVATRRATLRPSGCSLSVSSIVERHGSCSRPRMRFARR